MSDGFRFDEKHLSQIRALEKRGLVQSFLPSQRWLQLTHGGNEHV